MADKEYGIDDLAKLLKVSPATARAKLRVAKVKKEGKSYTWSSQTALQAIAKKLDSGTPKTAKKAVKKVATKKAVKKPARNGAAEPELVAA